MIKKQAAGAQQGTTKCASSPRALALFQSKGFEARRPGDRQESARGRGHGVH